MQRLGKQHGLAAARQQLLETLSNYQKYSEKEIVVVFDAMDAAGPVQKQQERNLMVVFFQPKIKQQIVTSRRS